MRRFFRAALASWVILATMGCGSGEDLQGPSQPAAADGGTGGSGGSGGSAGAAGSVGGAGGAAGEAPGDAAPPDAPGPTVQQACAHLGQVLCGRIDSCAKLLMDIWYDDAASCADVLSRACVEALNLPDTAKTAGWTDACATALQGWSCEDLLTRNTPAACVPPPGPRADGSPCGEDGQCASAYCASGLDETCGHCRPKSGTDGPCGKDDDCQPMLACNANGVCVPYGSLDQPCDGTHPCQAWLSCTRGTGSEAVCKPAAGDGDKCESQPPGQNPGCNPIEEYFCTGITHVCQKLKLASAGSPCGVVGTDYAICTAASFCKTTGMTGTCLAPSGVGGACDLTNGPFCEAELKCPAGKCVDPDLTTCN